MPEHHELRARLAAIRRRWLLAMRLEVLGRAAAAGSLPLFAAAGAAWLLPPGVARLLLAGGLALLAAVLAWRSLRRMPRVPGDAHVARFVEEQVAALPSGAFDADALVSAVAIVEAPERHASGFADALVGTAVRGLRRLEPHAIVAPSALRRAAGRALAGAGLAAAALLASLPVLLQVGGVLWTAVFPGSVKVVVLTGDVRVPAGQPVRIEARLEGRAASLVGAMPSIVLAADGRERSVEMEPSGNGFGHAIEAVDRSFEYRVVAGGAASGRYFVTALVPPRITGIAVRYEYPPYTRLTAREETDGGDLYGPAGTRVRLVVHTDKPLVRGELAMAEGPALPLRAAGRTAAGELVLTAENAYRVRVADADGLQSTGLEYFIRLMDDRPPTVRLLRPAADQGITPLEEVAIEVQAEDDHGIESLTLVYTVAGRDPRAVALERASGPPTARSARYLLAAEDLGVRPGDVISYYAQARDVPRAKRSSVTRSDMFFLEVKPFTEEFVAAQSQAMAGGAAGQIDSLIAAQKEIINATWNLERRGGAGRSGEDVQAVGAAQAELRARVEDMMGGGRRRPRGVFPPQQIVLPGQPEAQPGAALVAKALEAMGRAATELQRERTSDAIPHEMAALQALLQAQAEVRRRQVMQSAAGAGQGGTSRADRDLSALFDRELQRQQQRTNYETPPAAGEEAEAESGSDALDRIRDLARRQEALARQQRGLAGNGTSDDELKRQLERLTREQERLRQQAAEIERRLREQSGSAGARGRSGAGGSDTGREPLERASERMRKAAAEMERRNTSGAAASSQEAAEALREMEQQLRRESPVAREQEAGEVRVEAQQIAEGQRRLADEAARAARGSGNADARKRVAAEQERLAERAAALERRMRALGDAAAEEPAQRFREAAREMAQARIAERMRRAAEQQRSLAAGASAGPRGSQEPDDDAAGAERELARDLDSLLGTLGGGAGSADRPPGEELARTRELRDRLDRLERRAREAESRAREGHGSTQQAQQAQQAYARELQRTRDTLAGQQTPPRGGRGGTPEAHEYSRSSPGDEPFKQDVSSWAELRKDVDLALEHYEASATARQRAADRDARLHGGGSERVPEAYRDSVAKYFEAIARERK